MQVYAALILVTYSALFIHKANRKMIIDLIYVVPVPLIGRILGWW